MGTMGSIQIKDKTDITVSPLIKTSTEAMLLSRDLILFQPDPAVILNNFKSEDRSHTLAARIGGTGRTAYPDGLKLEDEEKSGDAEEEDVQKPPAVDPDFVAEGEINAILVADSDILLDRFWVREQNFLGVSVPQAIANNGDFVINSTENLAGNSALISLRSRKEYVRPFHAVEEIRQEAEVQFRERQQELQRKLKETEQKIRSLQQEVTPGDSTYILNSAQSKEIEKFRQEQVQTRKELRAVQHELQKNIEKLGSWIRFINIGLIPLLIILLSLAVTFYNNFKANRQSK